MLRFGNGDTVNGIALGTTTRKMAFNRSGSRGASGRGLSGEHKGWVGQKPLARIRIVGPSAKPVRAGNVKGLVQACPYRRDKKVWDNGGWPGECDQLQGLSLMAIQSLTAGAVARALMQYDC